MEFEQEHVKVSKGGAFALKYVLTVTASAVAELGTSDVLIDNACDHR